jgi:hypothetical protein
MSSSSSQAIHSPDASAMPRLRARAGPPPVSFRRTRSRGSSILASALGVSSVDPSSMTISSTSTSSWPLAEASARCSIGHLL